MENNRYLVTGGAGFIGNSYVKILHRACPTAPIVVLDALTYAGNLAGLAEPLQDPQCTFVKGDICDRALLRELFARYGFTHVVNFAAETHVDRSIDSPEVFLNTNVKGTQALLDAAKEAWTLGQDAQGYPRWKESVKYLQVSTDEVYGSLPPTGFFTEESPLQPRSPYSAAKASADHFVLAYHHTYKMPVNITRCSNNYGPWQFPEKLIPLLIKHILEGKPLPVYGQGLQVRDWLFVEDHCEAINLVLHHGASGEVYNVGGHNELRNIDLVHMVIATVRELLETQPALRAAVKKEGGAQDLSWINPDLITFVRDRLGHDARYAIDPSKIHAHLGWLPRTAFAQGLRTTVQWYLAHSAWMEEVGSGQHVGKEVGNYVGKNVGK